MWLVSATMRHLEGRVVVVTGSSRGIGYAVAAELVAQGARVVVNGRDAAVVDAAVEELVADAPGAAVGVAGSAAEPAVAQALMDAAAELGGLTDLVACAGTAEPTGSSILTVTPEQWQDLIDAHLTSAFQVARLAGPLLVERGGGSIVLTGSHAFTGSYGGSGYPAAKGATVSLGLAMAAELRDHGVRVNTVCPGARTRLSTGDDYEAQIEDLHRRGILDDLTRMGSLDPAGPEYVARLYAFLLSDLAADITGQTYVGSGCFLGRFARPEAEMITWADHHTTPPLTLEQIAGHLA